MRKKDLPRVLSNLQGFEQFTFWVSGFLLLLICAHAFSLDSSSCSFPLVVTLEDAAHEISCGRCLLLSFSLMTFQLTGACLLIFSGFFNPMDKVCHVLLRKCSRKNIQSSEGTKDKLTSRFVSLANC